MRGAIRRLQHDEEEESAFVSMTDLTVSFLFIVIILLAFFASQFTDGKTIPVDQYNKVVAERNSLRDSKEILERELTELRRLLALNASELAQLRREREALLAENADLRGRIAALAEELRQERLNRLQNYL